MNINFASIRRMAYLSFILILLLGASSFMEVSFKTYIIVPLILLLCGSGIYLMVEINRIGKLIRRTSEMLAKSTDRDFSSINEGEKHIINHEISNLMEQLEDSITQTEQILTEKDKLEKEAESLRLKIKTMEQNLNSQVIKVRNRMREKEAAFNRIISDMSSLIDTFAREKEMIDTLLGQYGNYSESYENIKESFIATRSICSREEARGKTAESTINDLLEKDEEKDERIGAIMQGIANIKDVTGIINEMADKASILSLNAAIESAHAGEAGKGFSVVAEEVGVLSDMTAEHAEIINQALFTVTDSVNESRFMEDEEDESFNLVSETIREMTASFKEIDSLLEMLTRLDQPVNIEYSAESLKDRSMIVETQSELTALKREWEQTLEDISRFPLFERDEHIYERKTPRLTRHETSVKPLAEGLGEEELD